jgi:transcriptional regulator with XRE-family HTH domain
VSKREFRPDLGYQKAFGARVRQLREEARWTQVDLAVYAGVSEYQISVIENGHQGPNFQTLRAISIALGKHPKDLLDFKYTLKLNTSFPRNDKKRPGTTRLILDLIGKSYFINQKTVNEVLLEVRAISMKKVLSSEVSAILTSLVKRKKLIVVKKAGMNRYEQT